MFSPLTNRNVSLAGVSQLSELEMWQDNQTTMMRAARFDKMKSRIDEVTAEEEADNLLTFLQEGKTFAILDVGDQAQQFKMSGIFSHVVGKDVKRDALVSYPSYDKLRRLGSSLPPNLFYRVATFILLIRALCAHFVAR